MKKIILVLFILSNCLFAELPCLNLSDPGTYENKVVNASGVFYVNNNTVLCTDTYSTTQTLLIMNSSNIYLDCNNSILNGDRNGVDYGINANSKSNINISNCFAQNFYHGFYVNGGSNNTLINNSAYNNLQYGFLLSSSSNNNLTNNSAYNNSYSGFYLYSGSNNNLRNNSGYNNSYAGFYLYSSSNNNLTNNSAYNNSYSGFYLYSGSNNNILTNNSAYNNSQRGFYLYSSSNNTLTNNSAYNNSQHGFYLSLSSNNTLTNNSAYNNSQHGFLLSSSSNNTLTNNSAYNNLYQVYIISSSDNLIYNNIFNASTGQQVAYDDSSNFWNTSYNCSTPNIIGGSCIGGNWYSDFNGVDNGFGVYPHNVSGDKISDEPEYYSIGSNQDMLPLTYNTLIVYNITSCDQTLVSGRYYVLNNNLTCTNKNFVISAGNVIINGKGNTVTLISTSVNTHMYLVSHADSNDNYISNITIKNLKIYTSKTAGYIYLFGVSAYHDSNYINCTNVVRLNHATISNVTNLNFISGGFILCQIYHSGSYSYYSTKINNTILENSNLINIGFSNVIPEPGNNFINESQVCPENAYNWFTHENPLPCFDIIQDVRNIAEGYKKSIILNLTNSSSIQNVTSASIEYVNYSNYYKYISFQPLTNFTTTISGLISNNTSNSDFSFMFADKFDVITNTGKNANLYWISNSINYYHIYLSFSGTPLNYQIIYRSKNEENITQDVNLIEFQGEYEFHLPVGNKKININKTNTNVFPIFIYPQFNVTPDFKPEITSTEVYTAEGYTTRLMTHFLNFSNTSGYDLTIYLLPYGYSSYVVFHVSDADGFPATNKRVIAKRHIFGTGDNIDVTSCITDDQGQCGMWLRIDNSFYFWSVYEYNSNELLYMSPTPQQISCNPTCAVYITLGEKKVSYSETLDFGAECKLNLTYESHNGTFIKKIATSGSVICTLKNTYNKSFYLVVEKENKDIICQNISENNAITCYLDVNVTNIYKLYYFENDVLTYLTAGSYHPEKEVIFGNDGIFFGILGIVAFSLFFTFNTTLMGTTLLLGGIVLASLNIIPAFLGFLATGLGAFIIIVSLKMGGRL